MGWRMTFPPQRGKENVLLLNAVALSMTVQAFQPRPQPCFRCPFDWIGYRGKCYYFSEAEGNWTSSQDNCSALGASLAMLDSMEDLVRRHEDMVSMRGKKSHQCICHLLVSLTALPRSSLEIWGEDMGKMVFLRVGHHGSLQISHQSQPMQELYQKRALFWCNNKGLP